MIRTEFRFTTPDLVQPGTLAEMLMTCYAPLVSTDRRLWDPEVAEWERFDHEVYMNPSTIGDCTFITWWKKRPIGFASFDPRSGPENGVIGHNCIRPEFQNQGAGEAQIHEILRRFKLRKIRNAHVSTLDHPFFHTAYLMYLACGFEILDQQPWPAEPAFKLIRLERNLEDTD